MQAQMTERMMPTEPIVSVLLIEDNFADIELFREMMSECEEPCFLHTADRLSSGLKLLGAQRFDAVLLDLGLPDSSGIETFRKIQSQAPNLPVVVLTGYADEKIAAEALSLGAQDYLLKGEIESGLLLRSIRYAIERKRAEEALRESEARLHRIASTALDAVVLIDNDGDVSFWNDAATRMFGYTNEEISGKYLHSFIMPERHIDAFKKGFEAFRTTGEGPFIGKVYEIEAIRKDGTEFPVELSLAALKLKGKWCAVGIVRDISERKRAEEDLRRTQTLLSEAEKLSHSGAWEWDLVTNEWTFSDEWLAIHGCLKRTLTPDELLQIAHTDDRPAIEQAFDDVRKGVRPYDIEHRIIRQDTGEVRIVRARGRYVRDPAGAVAKVYGFAQDITERKQVEESLKKSEENYRSIFNTANDAIFIHDIQTGAIIAVNRKMSEMYGYSSEEATRMDVEALSAGSPGYSRQDSMKWIRRAVEGDPQLFEWLAKRKNGELFWVEVNLKRAVIGGNVRLLAIVRDISERKQAEQELSKMTRQTELILESAGDGIFGMDSLGNHILANSAGARMLGYAPG